MNAIAIKNKTTSVQESMTRFDEKLQEKFDEKPTCDDFEDLLPHFSHMRKISNCRRIEQNQIASQIMKVIRNLQEKMKQLDGIAHSSVNICRSLIYIVNSSNFVVHLLNQISKSHSIPLSREHHKNFVQVTNNCLEIANNRANSISTTAVNLPIMSSLLECTINMYKQTAESLNSAILEHCLLQDNYTKMLEQTSKLFH